MDCPPDEVFKYLADVRTLAAMDRQNAAYEAHGPRTGVRELVLKRLEMPPFAPLLKPDAPKVSARPPAFALPAE